MENSQDSRGYVGTYVHVAQGTTEGGREEGRRERFALGTGTGTGRAAVRSERYIFLNILVTVRNRLVTQPCHLLPALPITYLLLTKYVPGHRRGYAVRFWLPRNPLSSSLASFYLSVFLFSSFSRSFVTIWYRATRKFLIPRSGRQRVCVSVPPRRAACIARIASHSRDFYKSILSQCSK